MTIRRAVWRLGLRYRVDVAPVAGRQRADLVFSRAKVAVYVDGCFWHMCPAHASIPNTNSDWWIAKLKANVARDRATDTKLRGAGWTVIRIWEHEAVDSALRRIADAVGWSALPKNPSGLGGER